MSDLDDFVNRGWEEHSDDAVGVAARLPQALALVSNEHDMVKLGALAHHVHGEHLAAWHDGLEFMRRLEELRWFDNYGASGQSLRRWRASLRLAAGDADACRDLEASDRVRVGAMTAAALALHDIERALALFEQALADAPKVRAEDPAPMHRALAVTGNNLASTLEDKPERTARERELMIRAAEAGRRYWELAGTWLEVERAEYRLAMSWLAAGDTARARRHAQACLDIIGAQKDPPALERFFGFEALARTEQAAGAADGFTKALGEARAAFAALEADDQAWCRSSLDALETTAPEQTGHAPG